MQTCGNIPKIIRNDERLYEGDLIFYFRVFFRQAQNLCLPYHDFDHVVTHVLRLCYQACLFYQSQLSRRERRNLLIAGLFHDFNHSGNCENDHLNIRTAIEALNRHILEEDRPHLAEIEATIRVTEFPYTVTNPGLTLLQQIIRDADLSQAWSDNWFQQVILGLSREWQKAPLEVLREQVDFLNKLRFYTDWARQLFPPAVIQTKIVETREFLELLEEKSTSVVMRA